MRRLIPVLVFTLLCAGAYWGHRVVLGSELARAQDSIAALERADDEAMQRLSSVERLANSVAARPAIAGEALPEPVRSAEPERPEPNAAPPAEPTTRERQATASGSAPVEAVQANMAAVFSDEAIDRSWSPAATLTIRNSAQSMLAPGSELRALDCRSSMCRMEVGHADMGDYAQFAEKASRGDFCTECFWTQTGETADGRPIMTMYVARPGSALPKILD